MHLRPRGPEPRALLLSYTQRTHRPDAGCGGTPPVNRTLQARDWKPGPSPEGDARSAADEATTLRDICKDNAAHPARLVPPRGFEPHPTTFAVSCPIPGTVAGQQGRSRWNRTITCAGMGRDGALHGLRELGAAAHRYPWRELHPRCRFEKPEYWLLYDTDVIPPPGPAGLNHTGVSVTGIEPALPVGKTEVLGRCTTRTNRPTQEPRTKLGIEADRYSSIINAFGP